MKQNTRTLASYEAHVEEYVAGTSHVVSGAAKDWIDAALRGFSRDAALMELGSAFGRDAAYIMERGFSVKCTDATAAFVQHLRERGFDAQHFDVSIDAVATAYDLILANAVLLHFTRDEFAHVLAKMVSALRPRGCFAFSLKRGDGEEWSNAKLNAPRYFCYWQPEELPPILARAGFSRWTVTPVLTDRKHGEWIYVIAWK